MKRKLFVIEQCVKMAEPYSEYQMVTKFPDWKTEVGVFNEMMRQLVAEAINDTELMWQIIEVEV